MKVYHSLSMVPSVGGVGWFGFSACCYASHDIQIITLHIGEYSSVLARLDCANLSQNICIGAIKTIGHAPPSPIPASC